MRNPPATPRAHDTLVLIHGEEDFAVKQRARELFASWATALDNPDQEIIDAQAGNAGEALRSIGRAREALNTLPFFGGSKLVWWRNCNLLGEDRTASGQAVNDALIEWAQELKTFPWDKTRLLISAGKVDKRKTFYKTAEKIGRVEAFPAWSADANEWQGEAERLVGEQLRERDKRMTDEALAELLTSVGPNRPQLLQEIEKLCLYAADEPTIEIDAVQAIVTRNKQARAFALADALGERNLPRVLRTLDEELWEMQFDRQKSEIGLLYGLISKVRMMILVKELLREKLLQPVRDYGRFKSQWERLPEAALPTDKRFNPKAMNPYPLFRAMTHAQNYSLDELVAAMQRLLESNRRLVSSQLEGSLIVQQTLAQIVRGSSSGAEPRKPLTNKT